MPLKDAFVSFWKPMAAASSLRGPFRSEALVLTVTTASKRYQVPTAWLGMIVDLQADGADVYIQFSNAADAAADSATSSVETLNAGTYTVAPHATPNECRKIANGETVALPFPSAAAATFAIIGSAAGKLRVHPSET